MHGNQTFEDHFQFLGFILELLRPNCIYSSLLRPAGIMLQGILSWFGSAYSLEYATIYYFFTSLEDYQQRFAADVYFIFGLFVVIYVIIGVSAFAFHKVKKEMQHTKSETEFLLYKSD